MIADGIVIHWHKADEYLDINLDDPNNLRNITSALDWWRKEKVWTKYNVKSRINRLSNGSVQIIIDYDKDHNKHLDSDEYFWGTSTITLTRGKEIGNAVWKGYDNKKYDGQAEWERIKTGLIEPKKRQKITKLQREQAKFRSALLACENHCVLTMEQTSDALEAAHIIPCKDGGTEVVQNGIILRADIHRLYDAGKFFIDPSGAVVNINDDLSEMYKKILNEACLPKDTIKRIQEALQHQWDNMKR